MTLIQAIKSGLPLKRTGSCNWMFVKLAWFYSVESNNRCVICVDDILADDWEVQGPTITITKEMLLKAVYRIEFPQGAYTYPSPGEIWQRLVDEASKNEKE